LIKKVVAPVAGLGTRLLSVTKEQPKEMLPVFSSNSDGGLVVKPLVQMIFEQLCSAGVNEFCFVVGRGKRAIVDHFTQDLPFVRVLEKSGRSAQAAGLRRFYDLLSSSTIAWVNQPEPLGFGHSLLMASSFVGDESFMVHAGDTYIIPSGSVHIERLADAHEKSGADATILLARVPPTKGYGYAVLSGSAAPFTVKDVVEKPAKPPSNLAIVPIYAFSPAILEELKKVRPGVGGEIQLTDGIQRMIEGGYAVKAVILSKRDLWLDIGTPEKYWEALRTTHERYWRKMSA